jgi:hypothetical protein
MVVPGVLLADPRTQAILLALADGPHRPCELEQLPGISRSTLFLRLNELKAIGILLACELSRFPLRIAYGLSGSGRVALTSALLGERRQRRMLAATGPSADLSDLLRCLAPVCSVDRTCEGLCVLSELEPEAPATAVRLLVADQRIEVLSELDAAHDVAVVSVAARPGIWERALVTGDSDGLEIEGAHEIAVSVLQALSGALSI